MFNPISTTYHAAISTANLFLYELTWKPFVLFLHIVLYTPFIKIPFLPAKYILQLEDTYDPYWLFEQMHLFLVTVVQFSITSAFIGVFFGLLTGLHLKIIRYVFSFVIRGKQDLPVPDAKKRNSGLHMKIGNVTVELGTAGSPGVSNKIYPIETSENSEVSSISDISSPVATGASNLNTDNLRSRMRSVETRDLSDATGVTTYENKPEKPEKT